MEKENKEDKEKKVTQTKKIDIKEMTTCDATAQMLAKAQRDGVETAFDRAVSMKACPIGADSACCKHCAMGPCRLSSKDPYGKVGVCGATIDTIMARNFARMVTSGAAAHTDHGMDSRPSDGHRLWHRLFVQRTLPTGRCLSASRRLLPA